MHLVRNGHIYIYIYDNDLMTCIIITDRLRRRERGAGGGDHKSNLFYYDHEHPFLPILMMRFSIV